MRSAKHQYLNYLEDDFEFFALQAWHVAPMVKFGMVECTAGPLLDASMTILPKFYQILEYKCPTDVYPLCSFYKICSICRLVVCFRIWWLLKFWCIHLRGYRVMGVLKLMGGLPQFSVPPNCKTIRHILIHFGGARMWSRSSVTVPSLVGVEHHLPSLCLSRFWMSEIVRTILPSRHWSTEMILMPLDWGRLSLYAAKWQYHRTLKSNYCYNCFTAPWTVSGTTRVSQYEKGKTRKVKQIWIYWNKR